LNSFETIFINKNNLNKTSLVISVGLFKNFKMKNVDENKDNVKPVVKNPNHLF
jgi:hypothetical protein